MTRPAAIAATLLAVPCSMAQPTGLSFRFPGGSVYRPGGPPVTVEVWAFFDPIYYAFAAADFDVLADSTGRFSDLTLPFIAAGTRPGTIQGGSVAGIISGWVLMPFAAPFHLTDNPILIWSGRWATDDPTPRTIDLTTFTHRYHVYWDSIGNNGPVSPTAEAHGGISVIPAPPTAAFGALALIAARRRRR